MLWTPMLSCRMCFVFVPECGSEIQHVPVETACDRSIWCHQYSIGCRGVISPEFRDLRDSPNAQNWWKMWKALPAVTVVTIVTFFRSRSLWIFDHCPQLLDFGSLRMPLPWRNDLRELRRFSLPGHPFFHLCENRCRWKTLQVMKLRVRHLTTHLSNAHRQAQVKWSNPTLWLAVVLPRQWSASEFSRVRYSKWLQLAKTIPTS